MQLRWISGPTRYRCSASSRTERPLHMKHRFTAIDDLWTTLIPLGLSISSMSCGIGRVSLRLKDLDRAALDNVVTLELIPVQEMMPPLFHGSIDKGKCQGPGGFMSSCATIWGSENFSNPSIPVQLLHCLLRSLSKLQPWRTTNSMQLSMDRPTWQRPRPLR